MNLLKEFEMKEHIHFYNFLNDILFKKKEREEFYRKLLKIVSDVSKDILGEYYATQIAERKSLKQDFTPEAIAKIVSFITRSNKKNSWSAYDPTAGTGGLIIKKWWEDLSSETPFTYEPHRFFYRADELSDTALPFLLHNLALRGMNCVVVHGDVLEKKAKNIYFVQNSEDDYLHFSDINVLPRTETIKKYFEIKEWIGEEIKHIESNEVKMVSAAKFLENMLTETVKKALREVEE